MAGDVWGSLPLQSKQRNFRRPLLTTTNRIGLSHLGQMGGGVFLAIRTLVETWREFFYPQSPLNAVDGVMISERCAIRLLMASYIGATNGQKTNRSAGGCACADAAGASSPRSAMSTISTRTNGETLCQLTQNWRNCS
jgi:hypothetical protein